MNDRRVNASLNAECCNILLWLTGQPPLSMHDIKWRMATAAPKADVKNNSAFTEQAYIIHVHLIKKCSLPKYQTNYGLSTCLLQTQPFITAPLIATTSVSNLQLTIDHWPSFGEHLGIILHAQRLRLIGKRLGDAVTPALEVLRYTHTHPPCTNSVLYTTNVIMYTKRVVQSN